MCGSKMNGKKKTRRKYGYTQTEMLVVLSLIGLILSLSRPALNIILPELRLEFAVRQFQADMMRAKRTAIFEAKFADLYVNNQSGIYYIQLGDDLFIERKLLENIHVSIDKKDVDDPNRPLPLLKQ